MNMQCGLRDFLEQLNEEKLLERISKPVSVDYEAAYWLKTYDGMKAVLMEKPIGYSIPIVGNILCSRHFLYKALKVENDSEAFSKLLKAINEPKEVKIEGNPGCFKSLKGIDCLPVLRSYQGEAGRYLTASILIAREPGGEVCNASIHRMLVLDNKHLAVRLVPRHLYMMYMEAKKRGEHLPAAAVIGTSPEFYIAAAASPPYGVFELEVANTLAEGKIKAFDAGNGLPVPLDSEIVLLGRLRTDIETPEGPFVDILGTLDTVRNQPVLEVDEVLIREGVSYYTILQGGREHILLMGFPREAAIWDSIRKVVPRVKSVRLLESGGGWLIAVISITKNADGDAKNALLAAFAAHPSLKIAVTVDEDLDIDNPSDLLWALATRMQPDEDLIILKGCRGSSLDPSADQSTLTTSKLGIDATIPLTKQRELFHRAKIPWNFS
ncbi:MAG: UbiD family decarboxylase [Thermofilaceae archaeon]